MILRKAQCYKHDNYDTYIPTKEQWFFFLKTAA